MSFPSSSGTKQDSLAQAWSRARDTAASVKSKSQTLRTAAAAGSVGSSAILDHATFLADAKVSLQRSAGVSGIVAYARDQIADQTVDITAEFNNMISALDGVESWVIANFPKDGSGILLARTFAADNSGRTQDRQFTPAQTLGLRTALDSLIAAID